MLNAVYIVTDLGPGDGGKGGVVHALVHHTDAAIVIKRGGAQGSHGVRTSRGEKFCFSTWGCGTFEGVPTHCSDQMVISPVVIKNEADALKRMGIYDPFMMLTVDPFCIVSTPLHMIASQLEELKLGSNSRGTIGTGVGRAYRMKDRFGNTMTIRAYELTDPKIITMKLSRQAEFYREKYAKFPRDECEVADTALIDENLDLLYDEGLLVYAAGLFEAIGKQITLRGTWDVVQHESGTAIVECSHGVLTDAEEGLKPHVSAIRTLPKFVNKMLRDYGYGGKIVNLAVHRAYEIRHGAGPMPTYDSDFTEQMLPGSHKMENRWQGKVRAGALDLNLMRYALKVSKETRFDGICLTWFDQILANGNVWPICGEYQNLPLEGESCMDFLKRAKPVVKNYKIEPRITNVELFEMVDAVLKEELGIPLAMLSVGPTEQDKIFSVRMKEEMK